VDELLARKEFIEMWVMKWAELLQIRSAPNKLSYKAALLYYNWLQDKLANNRPINEIVQELLTASGGTFKTPPSNYFQNETETLKTAENVAGIHGHRVSAPSAAIIRSIAGYERLLGSPLSSPHQAQSRRRSAKPSCLRMATGDEPSVANGS
jgi:hypothetical protein